MNKLNNQELLEAYIASHEMGDSYGAYLFGEEMVKRGIDGSSDGSEAI